MCFRNTKVYFQSTSILSNYTSILSKNKSLLWKYESIFWKYKSILWRKNPKTRLLRVLFDSIDLLALFGVYAGIIFFLSNYLALWETDILTCHTSGWISQHITKQRICLKSLRDSLYQLPFAGIFFTLLYLFLFSGFSFAMKKREAPLQASNRVLVFL